MRPHVLLILCISPLTACDSPLPDRPSGREGLLTSALSRFPFDSVRYSGSVNVNCTGYWKDLWTKNRCTGWSSQIGLYGGRVQPGYRICRVNERLGSRAGHYNYGWRIVSRPGENTKAVDVYVRACPAGAPWNRERSWINVQYDVYTVKVGEDHKFCDYPKAKLPFKKTTLELCDPIQGARLAGALT